MRPGTRRRATFPKTASGLCRGAAVVAVLASMLWVGAQAGAQVRAQHGAEPGTTVVRGDTVPVVAHLSATSFTQPGPFGVGEATLSLPTNGAPVEVWYPATKASVANGTEATYDVVDWLPPALKKLVPAGFTVTYPSGGVRGVAVAPGRYPLVVFSHGYAGFRDQSTFLTARLASWGFVVAAPDHLSRDLTQVLGGGSGPVKTTDVDDLKATIALMGSQNASESSVLHHHIDTSLVAAVGHSAGGAAVEALAAVDPRVTTFIGLAGATVGSFGQRATGPDSIVPHQPGMLMVGTNDHVANPRSIVAAYGKMRSPKRLILVRGAGHLVFADICEVGAGQGGLLAIAAALHVPVPASLMPLATDGCKAPDVPPPSEWPLVRQAVTAQLRHVFGFDHSTAGLEGLAAAFPHQVAESRAAP
jgi:predicted dienelactone hydrolase